MTFPRRILVLVMVLLTVLPLSATLAQDGGGSEIDTLLNAALAALSAEVGQPVTNTDLTNWGWQEQFFPDASLGCPQPDTAYAQEITRGFIFRLDYGGTVYEYHLTPDAQVIVLCGAEASSAPTLAPADPPAAATPAVTDTAPEQLLNLGLAYLNSQLNTSMTRMNITRWTWEEMNWDDTSLGCPQPEATYDNSAPVRGFGLTVEHVGQVYELHMTANGRTIMPCGDNAMLQPVLEGQGFEGLTAESAQPTAEPAQQEEPATSAASLFYTGADGNVYVTDLADFPGQQITDAPPMTLATPAPLPRFDHIYGLYRWSPTGEQIAFVDSAPPANLLMVDVATNAVTDLETGGELATLYPPAWSPDGSQIAFVRPTQTFRGPNQVMEVYIAAVSAENDQTPTLLTSFEQQVGCGGGSADPADTVYSRETGFMGNSLAFEWLADDTLLIAPTCLGVGLVRVNPTTGEATQLDQAIARISLNPDRTQVAGLVIGNETPELVTLDLTTGTRTPVAHQITGTPDQVYWSPDGTTLWVSTVDLAERIARSGTQDSIGVYTVRLWEVALADGTTTLRLEQQGRGIGSIVGTPDGGVIFSFVEDARAWASAADSGADADAQRAAAPSSWLLRVTPDGQVERIGYGGQPALQPAAPNAVG